MERIGQTYLDYMEDVFAFYEGFSQDLLGYELPQVLLIHANALNADYFDGLADMMKMRGYEFVPLAEALEDPAYQRGASAGMTSSKEEARSGCTSRLCISFRQR